MTTDGWQELPAPHTPLYKDGNGRINAIAVTISVQGGAGGIVRIDGFSLVLCHQHNPLRQPGAPTEPPKWCICIAHMAIAGAPEMHQNWILSRYLCWRLTVPSISILTLQIWIKMVHIEAARGTCWFYSTGITPWGTYMAPADPPKMETCIAYMAMARASEMNQNLILTKYFCWGLSVPSKSILSLRIWIKMVHMYNEFEGMPQKRYWVSVPIGDEGRMAWPARRV